MHDSKEVGDDENGTPGIVGDGREIFGDEIIGLRDVGGSFAFGVSAAGNGGWNCAVSEGETK